MRSTKEIFKGLIGTWTIKRVLGNYGTAEGTARFTLLNQSHLNSSSSMVKTTASSISIPSQFGNEVEGEVVRYREDLEVKLNDLYKVKQPTSQKNNAYKEYVYVYDELRDKIIKKFTDGRLFYELSVDGEQQVANGDHLCEKDFYKAVYHFKDAEHFSLTYHVKGPEKDYVIQTQFTKSMEDSVPEEEFKTLGVN